MAAKNLLNAQLIVFDGLPGSGKSTTGQWLTSQLQAYGFDASWLPESELPHPLWWYKHWNGTEFQTPDFENTPIETFLQASLNKWKDFTELSARSGTVHVTESVFFQNAVAIFLMGGAQREMLTTYAHEVQKITSRLRPILIYFRQDDVANALRRICLLRGKDFEEELIHNMESFPYLQHRTLKGLHGVTVLWRDIEAITDALFDSYTIPRLAIETSAGNWHSYRQQILEFLRFTSPL